jgi:cytochrome b561/polyisoprenoid-binding protein YceI
MAADIPVGTSAEVARKAYLTSLHKTLGLAIFAVALLRILWAFFQTKPAALHPERRLETFLADTVHWALYLSLVLVPLSGWLTHAAAEGFAPILWPFGQNLPFVPKSPELAETFGAMHWLFGKVLIGALLLHLAGVIKHVVWDRDATLPRMWVGKVNLPMLTIRPHSRAPAFAAILIWAGIVALGLRLADGAGASATLAPAQGGWAVSEGTIRIGLRQMGAEAEASFETWNADIEFSPETGLGRVSVLIDTGSFKIGPVTRQALGPDFLGAEAYPQAVFAAQIRSEGEGYVAQGTLTLRGISRPLALPFALDLEGETARMSGQVTLDRRDFGIGLGITDEGQIGYAVEVRADLVATRAP